MARAIVAVGVLGVLGALVVPFATDERLLPAAIPQPKPLFSTPLIDVRPREEACLSRVAMDEHSEVALVQIATFERPGVPFALTASGPGYRASTRSRGQYNDNDVVAVDLRPPPRPLPVRVCVRNQGRHRMQLYAADDRTQTRGITTIDGRRAGANFDLAFHERREASFAGRWATTAHRLTTFRPGGPWLAWLLAALVVLGVPLALIGAVWTADEDEGL